MGSDQRRVLQRVGPGGGPEGGLALQTPPVWFKRPSEPGSDLSWLNQPFVLLHCAVYSAGPKEPWMCVCDCIWNNYWTIYTSKKNNMYHSIVIVNILQILMCVWVCVCIHYVSIYFNVRLVKVCHVFERTRMSVFVCVCKCLFLYLGEPECGSQST